MIESHAILNKKKFSRYLLSKTDLKITKKKSDKNLRIDYHSTKQLYVYKQKICLIPAV